MTRRTKFPAAALLALIAACGVEPRNTTTPDVAPQDTAQGGPGAAVDGGGAPGPYDADAMTGGSPRWGSSDSAGSADAVNLDDAGATGPDATGGAGADAATTPGWDPESPFAADARIPDAYPDDMWSWSESGPEADAGSTPAPDAAEPVDAQPEDATTPGDTPPPPAPTCAATAKTGDYCGGDKVDFASAKVLYACKGPGPAKVVEECKKGCVVAPAGQDDTCAPVTPTCTSTAKTGDYCGGDKVTDGSAATLYACKGPGPATVVSKCTDGCVIAPAGQDDYCAPSAATCGSTAKTGDYCDGDKVTGGSTKTLYHCSGPGPAKAAATCQEGCVVAPAGQDDYCKVSGPACAHKSLLAWGLCPDASDHLRCAGVTAGKISQTIGNAAASAGTHAKDGTIGGAPYCAATDLSVSGLSEKQVWNLVDAMTDQGFAAFYRNPGHDGWPSSEARHIHAIYPGVKMKAALQAQVMDWLAGKNGLASHGPYTFFKPTSAQKKLVALLFESKN